VEAPASSRGGGGPASLVQVVMTEVRHRRAVILLAFVAFVSLGLPDGVLGVAWPSIRATFHQPISRIAWLLGAGTCGYLLSSFFSGQIIRARGVGELLVGSCVLASGALAGFALAPAWVALPAFGFIGGLAGGAIDAGINTFAADRFSARIVNWLHAFWGVGATLGPLLITAVLAAHQPWRVGYGILAAGLGVLAVLFTLTRGWWQLGHDSAGDPAPATARVGESLRQLTVVLHAALFLVYAGVESTAGQLLYSLFTEARGIAPPVAGIVVGAYWAALTSGRILFGQVATRVSRRSVVRIGTVLAPCAAGLLLCRDVPVIGMGGAVLLGFALAPIFPTLISLTPQRVGPYFAPQAVGFQVAGAAVGSAVFPGLVGLLARRFSLEVLGVHLLAAALVLLALHELGPWRRPRPPQ